MDVLTVRGAAKQLRTTPEQLIALLEDHTLIGEQLPNGQWLISSESLRAYRRHTADTGRPWSPSTAWAALAELDRLPLVHISTGTAHQLRQRLHTITPQTLARKLNRRGTIHTYETPNPALLASEIIPTGPSAAASSMPEPAHPAAVLHGYLKDPAISIGEFATTHHLARRIEGNLRLYDRPTWVTPDHLGPATIATDLANSTHDPFRQVGLSALADIQDRWIATQPTARRRR